ncbi:purple acid phosphatase family protein [Candidatus Uabimicrobium amorphum]|uniref:Metallophosphoesterase n=1 Tax=Uabimicrobium amorphum TaxID=2596890 RepID=A0A5S9IMJ6_UABAM|nr:metallophosphoesterase family protein [Candidatus Uabimicrobium amorphum]BBM84653.1 metallophosphoesterase [Candidatus Uabimicrobium amorphum]
MLIKNVVITLIFCSMAFAHVGEHASIHDTVHNIKQRLRQKIFDINRLQTMSATELHSHLTQEERKILGSEHLSFVTNTALDVYVAKDIRFQDGPFWLQERNFQKTSWTFATNNTTYQVWKKTFPRGWVGLGVNSLSGDNKHYFVVLCAKDKKTNIKLDKVYPGQHNEGIVQIGESPYVDFPDKLTQIPQELQGKMLLRTMQERSNVAKLAGIFTDTNYPASIHPDQIVLTWGADPRTTQSVQWRTSKEVNSGMVRYREQSATQWEFLQAKTKKLETPETVNDPVINRHSAHLTNLKPGTTYQYSVGNGNSDNWSKTFEFTTAPQNPQSFSFVYMGDAQNGLDTWGKLLANSFQAQPNAAFFVMAGDLVNKGAERFDWDHFFHSAGDIFSQRPIVPAIGNHEMHGGYPTLYREMFKLPRNGPDTTWIDPERAYSFEYGNACFIVLDTNTLIDFQTKWLEERLKNTKALWKFVIYHHPAYSPRPSINNTYISAVWGPIFDKYHVDVALQGHDHSYMRTHPLKNHKKAPTANEGTIYVVSVSGTKFYSQNPYKNGAVSFTNVSTYQLLDIQIEGRKLIYKAYDINGVLKDEFVIEK